MVSDEGKRSGLFFLQPKRVEMSGRGVENVLKAGKMIDDFLGWPKASQRTIFKATLKRRYPISPLNNFSWDCLFPRLIVLFLAQTPAAIQDD